MTDLLRDDDRGAQPDGVSSLTSARSLPRASPAAAPAADVPATAGSAAPVVSDLLDRVIQRIFTAGLLLTGAAQRSTPEVAASIEHAISALDEAVRDIRADAFRCVGPRLGHRILL